MRSTIQYHRTYFFPLLTVVALATVAFSPRAFAEQAKAPDHVKQLTEHLRAKDADAIQRDLTNITDAFAEATDKRARRRLLSAVGRVLRSKDDDLKRAALDTFEEMGDPAAWKYYGAILKKPFNKRFPAIASQAMDLTRALNPDGAITPLLNIMKKSKHLGAASKAVETLGAYRNSDKRAKILGELIRATRKEKPGVRGRENQVVYGPRVSGEQARDRWQALARPMVEAANQLTGQSYVSPEDWFDVWRENRRNPKVLFLEDDA